MKVCQLGKYVKGRKNGTQFPLRRTAIESSIGGSGDGIIGMYKYTVRRVQLNIVNYDRGRHEATVPSGSSSTEAF